MQSDFEKIIAFKRAVENNHSEEVAQIIQQQIRGIDERLFENNASALIYASTNGHLEIAQALIEAHVNLEQADKEDGVTTLIAAAQSLPSSFFSRPGSESSQSGHKISTRENNEFQQQHKRPRGPFFSNQGSCVGHVSEQSVTKSP